MKTYCHVTDSLVQRDIIFTDAPCARKLVAQRYLLVAVSLLALPTLIFAQTNNATLLDEVVVESVYAVSAEADNIGSSVTVLTDRDFKARNATFISDILPTVTGVSVGTYGGHGQLTSVFLRGADSDQTVLIVDGVKMNPATGSNVDFGTLPLANVERIEILRGEQSALWGSDAVGGVIYVTTKSGKYADKAFNADINLSGGSNATLDTAATIYGRQGGLYYSLAMANSRNDGTSALSEKTFTYQATDGTTFTTGGATEADKFQRGSGTLRVGYEFGNAGVEVLASHSAQTVHFDDNLATDVSSDAYTKTTENVLKLSGYVGSEDDLLKHSAFISRINSQSETTGLYPSDNDGKKRNASYQLDVNFDRDGAMTQAVTGLLEYQQARLNTSNFATEKTIEQHSAAVEYRLFTDTDHAFSAGLRYDNNNEFDNALTYRLAGGYRINDNLRLHSSFATAVKNPTMYDYYGFGGNYVPNPDLQPEKSRGGDIGLTIESQDARHTVDMTYFNRRVEDLITTNANWDGSINLEGTSKMRGIELSYKGDITDVLSGYVNYTYTKTEDSSGKQLLRRPTHQASIGVDYRFNDMLSANANVVYIGKRMDSYYDSANWTSYSVKMPSYTLFNLGAEYQMSDNISIYANVKNVFDTSYENIVGYGQAERTFYLGVKGSF